MVGRRVPDETGYHLYQPGDYGRCGGSWYGSAPPGWVANLSNHSVLEHEDGTITVTPSVLVSRGDDDPKWHGYLEFGVWRTC